MCSLLVYTDFMTSNERLTIQLRLYFPFFRLFVHQQCQEWAFKTRCHQFSEVLPKDIQQLKRCECVQNDEVCRSASSAARWYVYGHNDSKDTKFKEVKSGPDYRCEQTEADQNYLKTKRNFSLKPIFRTQLNGRWKKK